MAKCLPPSSDHLCPQKQITTWRRPRRATVSNTVRFMRSSKSGWPVATLQNAHARVHTDPRIIMVACLFAQHSPIFGQAASSHTVTRSRSRIRRLVSENAPAYAGPSPAANPGGGLRFVLITSFSDASHLFSDLETASFFILCVTAAVLCLCLHRSWLEKTTHAFFKNHKSFKNGSFCCRIKNGFSMASTVSDAEKSSASAQSQSFLRLVQQHSLGSPVTSADHMRAQ